MALRFDERKTTQLVARLIEHGGGQLNVLKLVKLVYLTDRRALVEGGRPITFDRFVSMPHGPVNSATLNLLNDEPDPNGKSYWHSYISERSGYDVRLLKAPGVGALSAFELSIVDEVFAEFGHMDRFALRDVTHDLPEWSDPHGSSTPIHVHEILESDGYSEDEAREIEHALEHESFVLAELGA